MSAQVEIFRLLAFLSVILVNKQHALCSNKITFFTVLILYVALYNPLDSSYILYLITFI